MTLPDDPRKDLNEIRSMMERSSRFLSLSGLSGVSAGTVALIGAAAAWWKMQGAPVDDISGSYGEFAQFLVLDAIAVLIAATALSIYFTTRAAVKKGERVWDHTTRFLVSSLLPPLAAGGIFCLLLWHHGITTLITPAMLLFYGFALLGASKYTPGEVKYLAYAEILLGLASAYLLSAWLFMWATGFGAFHILYGVIMYRKYGQ
jgi:hypothetical protein